LPTKDNIVVYVDQESTTCGDRDGETGSAGYEVTHLLPRSDVFSSLHDETTLKNAGYMLEYPVTWAYIDARTEDLRGHRRDHEGHHREADGVVGARGVRHACAGLGRRLC
jgi:hypothetical protein